jgi:hypothetical protein
MEVTCTDMEVTYTDIDESENIERIYHKKDSWR